MAKAIPTHQTTTTGCWPYTLTHNKGGSGMGDSHDSNNHRRWIHFCPLPSTAVHCHSIPLPSTAMALYHGPKILGFNAFCNWIFVLLGEENHNLL